MSAGTAVLVAAKARPQTVNKACRALVWFWLLAIGQYAYRYVFQVSDTRTSVSYQATPWELSAIKYALLAGFGLYVFLRLWRACWRVRVTPRMRRLLGTSTAGLFALIAVILARLVYAGGDLDRETWVCVADLLPWMASVFFVPVMVGPEHGVKDTLRVFERAGFWVAWPFWVVTVVLAATGVRYPALSHAGILPRFGGILDDPNGYACLCLLWLVVSAHERTGHWRWRVTWYVVMLIGTVSLAGYGMAIMMFALWAITRLFFFQQRRGFGVRSLMRVAIASVVAVAAGMVLATVWDTEQTVERVDRLLTAKTLSASEHIEDLGPGVGWFEDWNTVEVLCGKGGFSENFYWRVLANFGLVGLAAVVAVMLAWFYQALWKVRRWRGSLGVWGLGLLLASNGIAYLLVFPLNLICWSALALIVCQDATSGILYARARGHPSERSPLSDGPYVEVIAQ